MDWRNSQTQRYWRNKGIARKEQSKGIAHLLAPIFCSIGGTRLRLVWAETSCPTIGSLPFFSSYWLNRAGVRVHSVNRSCSAALIQRHLVRTACSQRNLCLCLPASSAPGEPSLHRSQASWGPLPARFKWTRSCGMIIRASKMEPGARRVDKITTHPGPKSFIGE